MSRITPLLLAVAALALAACAPQPVVTPPSSGSPSPTPPPIPTMPGGASTPTATTAPTSIPFIPAQTRLTDPGCCTGAFWSPDGQQVRYIDLPDGAARAGIYGVPITGGAPQLVSDTVGSFSPDGRYLSFLNRQYLTIVRDLAVDRSWVVPSDGRAVVFSPHSVRLAWTTVVVAGVYGDRRTDIYVSDLDGRNAQQVVSVRGGGLAGWLDDERLLVVGLVDAQGDHPAFGGLSSISVVDGTRVDLLPNAFIRSIQPSPGGDWILVAIAFDQAEPQNDGMWIIHSADAVLRKLDVVGSAQWRDASHLVVIPMEPGADSFRLVQVDAASGAITPLTDPATFSFRVLAAEWRVSPEGAHVVYLNAADQALWAFDLPPLK